ncbi:MAG: BlaI/MecI/CopY family transcriptional regulator [Caulobacteraceae bacterium]|nr:BlaI/MecI/CopY family transcriptional regulator [Caulobacteraceae bacterium]
MRDGASWTPSKTTYAAALSIYACKFYRLGQSAVTMHITAAESQIMDALWRRGALSADELIEDVGAREAWGGATVKTLINRLLKKKAVRSQRLDGKVRYAPVLQRADYVQRESQGLLDRLFEGNLTPLVAHFAEHRKLKPDEVERLKKLLEDLDDDD